MEWIPARAGLLVNELGQVRSSTGRILRGCAGKHGYLRTTVMHEGRKVNVSFHVIICEAFHGPKPHPSLHAAHRNGDKLDNRPDNLRWATPEENEADKKAHGRVARNTLKLTKEKVKEIRSKYASGNYSQRALAAEYGVVKATIRQVVNRVTWNEDL